MFVPTAIDLFAGPGGLSEGFSRSGFEIASQVEFEQNACQTLRLRVAFRELEKSGQLGRYWEVVQSSSDRIDPTSLIAEIERCNIQVVHREFSNDAEAEIHRLIRASLSHLGRARPNVLLGGPPCQAFSLAGRSRDPDRMRNDKRQMLFKHYLRALTEFEPDFFVFENVPGLLSASNDGGDLWQQLMDGFHEFRNTYRLAQAGSEGHSANRILDSSAFGVPQRRKRVFIIGYRAKLEARHPDIRNLFIRLSQSVATYPALTVDDAIHDLPKLRPGEGRDGWWGSYCDSNDLKAYQRKMRRGSKGVANHRARTHMQTDLARYEFFIERYKHRLDKATLDDLERDRPDLMPDHKHTDKFLDRFRVQGWDSPSSTIMSHIQKDGHYYIHPDPAQCRSFTVREAARCQSFPDNYVFCGSRTDQFRQVGNAVPPLLAERIGDVLLEELRQIYGTKS